MAIGHREGVERNFQRNAEMVWNECPSQVWMELVNDHVGDGNLC